MQKALLSVLLVAGLALAGCSSSPSGAGSDDGGLGSGAIGSPKEVQATSTTGGIRGVVVDQAVRPIKGATVTVSGNGVAKDATTDAGGTFSVSGLPAGTYLLKSSHSLYDSAQQSVEVKAGVKNPPIVKVLLTQKAFAKPYMVTSLFKGFIVCSIGAGIVASEECGEGVGLPCLPSPADQAPFFCHRFGGQGDNKVLHDFYVDGPFVRSIIVEQVWTPNSDKTGQFYTVAPATNWTCDPGCGGNQLGDMTGSSPLLSRIEVKDGIAIANKPIVKAGGTTWNNQTVTAGTKFSTFTWPAWDAGGPFATGVSDNATGPDFSASNPTALKPDPNGVAGQANNHPEGMTQFNNAANQDFQLLVSSFYYLPAPEGWSFVKGSADPFISS
jgi:hypothetical protein